MTANRKPRDDEIDVFGLTHPGKVRAVNQDHFLICTLRKEMRVLSTSLQAADLGAGDDQRVAFLAMVADGVGGGPKGEEASRLALGAVTHYVAKSAQCYYTSDSSDESFLRALEDAALAAHTEVVGRAAGKPDFEGMATTLTLWLGVWPRVYLLQVGDSRCYLLQGGTLTQISRDQTMAQALVDRGVLRRTEAARTPLAHVLSSSIGGSQTAPVVTRADNGWDNVWLLCSDGLTKHVPDERIRERLAGMQSARAACAGLLEDALEGGGSDNITIIVGRVVPREARD